MVSDDLRRESLAILVGGGPAPGINGVIAAAAIEAIKCGLRVIGLRDGFQWLAEGDRGHVVELGLEEVSRIHFTGGSILGTSRTNPARDETTLGRVTESLTALGVRYLICIGGDDTTYGAARIAERTKGRVGVVTVPKTIDNDLPLPENASTFGFETARRRRRHHRIADGRRTYDRQVVPGGLDGAEVGLPGA
jgi:6-phosphofructokinase 1